MFVRWFHIIDKMAKGLVVLYWLKKRTHNIYTPANIITQGQLGLTQTVCANV